MLLSGSCYDFNGLHVAVKALASCTMLSAGTLQWTLLNVQALLRVSLEPL